MYDKEYSDFTDTSSESSDVSDSSEASDDSSTESFYIKDTCICKINVSLKHVIKFESIKIKFY